MSSEHDPPEILGFFTPDEEKQFLRLSEHSPVAQTILAGLRSEYALGANALRMALKGDPHAMLAVAQYLEAGVYLPYDLDFAMKWCQLALDAGLSEAAEVLERIRRRRQHLYEVSGASGPTPMGDMMDSIRHKFDSSLRPPDEQ